jgi:hypothetical protein
MSEPVRNGSALEADATLSVPVVTRKASAEVRQTRQAS